MQLTRNEVEEIKQWCTRFNDSSTYIAPETLRKLSINIVPIVQETQLVVEPSQNVDIDLTIQERRLLKDCIKTNAYMINIDANLPRVYYKL